jgi:uncharacterized protein (TIGR04551 family)
MLHFRRAAVAIAPMLLLSASAAAQPQPTGDPADTPAPPTGEEPPAVDPTQPAAPGEAADRPEPRPALISSGSLGATGVGGIAPSISTAQTPPPDPGPPGAIAQSPDQVFAEDWWHMARPVLELHGYFRMRAELFHNFSLGRSDPYDKSLWPRPPDHSYTSWFDGQVQQHAVPVCGDDPLEPEFCTDKTQAGANVRFRLNPELHISDNLRIMSQIDLLDNLVLGSTPNGYANHPSASGYARSTPTGYTPLGIYNETMDPPTAGQNAYGNSIVVKRVWGEYLTPIGQLRFGRMPSHWGLGMVENAGDGFDSDYHSTVDRLMFITGFKALDLYFAAAWDLPGEGATSQTSLTQQGQAYDLAQLDDVNQYVLVLMRRKHPALQRLALSRGDLVLNGGMHFTYRHQFLANDAYNTTSSQDLGASPSAIQEGYVRRNARVIVPDLWMQLLYKKLRFEMEAVMVRGSMDNTEVAGNNYENLTDPEENGHKIRQYGLATQTEFRTVEDRLSLQFGFGWASGDPDVNGPQVGGLTPGANGLQQQRTQDRTDSTFRFHPDYRVDLILHRHILNRVQGTYYFRPSVDYDFSRSPNGQKFGGGGAVVWSRASEFVQAPGNKRDLGIEIDLQLYFQSKDGSLNDDPDKMGGFYTMLQYGVLFPLGGLGYLPGQEEQASNQGIRLETSAAHTLRWFGGIFF